MNKCVSFFCVNESEEHQLYCQKCLDKKATEKAINISQSLEQGEFSCESEIYCPYCGAENEIDDHELYDEGEHEVFCCECGKTFTANTFVRYSFDTRKGDS